MYAALNIFFFGFHTSLILFNLFGWMWKKTRKANLIVLLLTLASWFILGIWYGFGYCPCTDWHWQVRMKLGYTDMPYSYIKFLIDRLLGLDVNALLVDYLTVGAIFLALSASIYSNWRDWHFRKTSAGAGG